MFSNSGPDPNAEGTVELADGRELGYAEYGPPEGDPLVLFHGTPGSRYTTIAESALDTHGLRLITLERPGFGRSTFDPDREFIDWPADVEAATDALGVDEFALLGASGGGPYVLACAARIPERLTAVGVVSGLGPLGAPDATDGMAITSRIGFTLMPLPGVMWPVLWLLIQAIRLLPGHPGVTEGIRQGPKAPLYEHRLQVRPWGFDLTSIRKHVHLWHGEADTSTPLPMAEHVAAQLPSSTLQTYPDEGHSILHEHTDEVLSTLRDQW